MSEALFQKGPQPQSHTQRMEQIGRLVERLQGLYPGQVLAVGLYGSTARGDDGAFSDIELFCVVAEPELEVDYEWVYGAGKAEINVLGRETARREARAVDESWAISQGCFLNARLLAGDARILAELRELVRSVSDEDIRRVIGMALVGELYEWLGKARNARAAARFGGLPVLAVKFSEMCALLVGLANRACYKTGLSMLEDSLELPDLPEGYAGLCQLVIRGQLSDPLQVHAALEAAWAGTAAWAVRRGVEIRVEDFPG